MLPREAQDPVVIKQTGEAYALMYLSFNSEGDDRLADHRLPRRAWCSRRLQTINGVANAQILGGQTFAMRIWLDPDKMAALGVTPLDVRTALAANNFTTAAGQVKGDFVQTTINAKTSLDNAGGVRQAGGDGAAAMRWSGSATSPSIELGPQKRRIPPRCSTG